MNEMILLGVGGGIAAYKAAALCSLLTKRNYEVQVLMTEHAKEFIAPLTFQSLCRRVVISNTFAEPNPSEIAHISLADKASLYVIAPATANLIAKLAHGIADDMVTTTALAMTGPLVLAPAMNVHMYEHPAVEENLATLRRRGAIIIEPGTGPLACGYSAKGRLAEPEEIAEVLERILSHRTDMQGLRVLVTAGPTVEDIDPVRYLSNASTGKMGFALAEAAQARGASVTLVTGPVSLPDVAGVEMTRIRSTEDMLSVVLQKLPKHDVLIAAAAPADFRPVTRHREKWKKSFGVPELVLEPTPDILLAASKVRRDNQMIVGFAAETSEAVDKARKKLTEKRLDMLVVNDVTVPGAGFAVDTNLVTLLTPEGGEESLPLLSKREVAERILDEVVRRRRENASGGTASGQENR